MQSKTVVRTLLLLAVVSLPGAIRAQTITPPNPGEEFSPWVERQVQVTLKAKDEEAKVRINQRNITNQSETPSANSNSTSLADKSSVSDLVGIAFNLAGLSSKSSEQEMTSMSATVTAYAFKAAAAGRNPLDPAFYVPNSGSRNLSFTLGFDYPEGKQGDPTEKATNFGIKYLPYNQRDATNPKNSEKLSKVSDAAIKRGMATGRLQTAVQGFVFDALKRGGRLPASAKNDVQFDRDFIGGDHWPNTYNLLSDSDKKQIDKIFQDNVATFGEYATEVRKIADEIRKAPQFSLFFLTKQRSNDKPDEYMAEAIYDKGFAPQWNLTFNAAFMYKDNKMAKDFKGGKAAAELQVKLNQDKLEGRMPWLLTVGADGCWMTDMPSMYRGQAKLTIPIADGIDFPISVTLANRTELIKEKDVKGRFGFTFDVARLAQAFKGKFLGGN